VLQARVAKADTKGDAAKEDGGRAQESGENGASQEAGSKRQGAPHAKAGLSLSLSQPEHPSPTPKAGGKKASLGKGGTPVAGRGAVESDAKAASEAPPVAVAGDDAKLSGARDKRSKESPHKPSAQAAEALSPAKAAKGGKKGSRERSKGGPEEDKGRTESEGADAGVAAGDHDGKAAAEPRAKAGGRPDRKRAREDEDAPAKEEEETADAAGRSRGSKRQALAKEIPKEPSKACTGTAGSDEDPAAAVPGRDRGRDRKSEGRAGDREGKHGKDTTDTKEGKHAKDTTEIKDAADKLAHRSGFRERERERETEKERERERERERGESV
jgi:hypothetical protein